MHEISAGLLFVPFNFLLFTFLPLWINPKDIMLSTLLCLLTMFSSCLQFISSLKDNLNAEVALGTVTNVKEACAWLGYTYLSIRMKLNPLAYGIGWDEVWSIHFCFL